MLRPMKLPRALTQVLGVLPYAYLAVAVLFAATGTSWVICRLDPFVSFFPLERRYAAHRPRDPVPGDRSGGRTALLPLLLPLWRAPGAGLASFMEESHGDAAGMHPVPPVRTRLPLRRHRETRGRGRRLAAASLKRTGWLLALTPLRAALGAFGFWNLAPSIAPLHSTVFLSERLRMENADAALPKAWETRIWRELGKSKEDLHAQAAGIRSRLATGSLFAGGFIGLVFGFALVGLSRRVVRRDWEPDRAKCLACGRCFAYCPVDYQDPSSPPPPSHPAGENNHG